MCCYLVPQLKNNSKPKTHVKKAVLIFTLQSDIRNYLSPYGGGLRVAAIGCMTVIDSTIMPMTGWAPASYGHHWQNIHYHEKGLTWISVPIK